MREILFKAKRLDNGEWVGGSYVWDDRDKRGWIVYYWEDGERNFEVNPSTVCQYTGLHDKNGERIFEGDGVKVYDWGVNTKNRVLIDKAEVFWDEDEAAWNWKIITGEWIDIDVLDRWRNIEITGKIMQQ